MFAYNFFIRNYFAGTKIILTFANRKLVAVLPHTKITVLAWHTVRSAGESFFIYTMANKKSRSIQEQIDLLKNRGMIIEDEEFARLHLSHVSYYRLKGYWWDMQKDKNRHIFMEESRFEDVISRYFFDKELRLILFDAIETIEIALRTKMIYHLSQSFGGLFYTDKKLFVNESLHQQHIEDLMSEFMRSGEVFIKEYKRKYGVWEDGKCTTLTQQPDSWVVFEVATFGTLSKIYKNLCHQLPEKARIANDFGLNIHTELSSWLEAISYLRNIVAHHSRVWSRNMVKRPMDINNPKGIWLRNPLSEFAKKKPYLIITSMLYLCNAINAGDTYKKKIISLIEERPDIPIYKIGFPNHWNKEPIWQ